MATCCVTSCMCVLRFIILFSVKLISVMVLMVETVVNRFLQYFPRFAFELFLFLALPMSFTVLHYYNFMYWNNLTLYCSNSY